MTSHQLLTLAETIKAELLPRFPEIQGVQFSINHRFKARAGVAKYTTGKIEVSGYFYVQQSCNDILAANTIRHELAHIVAYKRFGRAGVGHNHLWRSTALNMGCNGKRCTSPKDGDEVQMVCQFCSHMTECSEKRMRKWDQKGRYVICQGCRKSLPYPWAKPVPQMAAEMPKRFLTQKGLPS